LKAIHRTVGPILPPTLLSRHYPGIPGRVHVDDQMLSSGDERAVRHYLDDARSAMHNLEESLRAAGRGMDDVRACLDFASGYGRVTRHLAQRLGPRRVTACDVDRQAIRFCAREFGVRSLRSRPDVGRIALRTYDLIFVGSLLTHLAPDAGLGVLARLVGALDARGLLVFSTQGETCLVHLHWYGEHFRRREGTYRARVARDGACFVPYPDRRDYGITIHARRWVEATMRERFAGRLQLVHYSERGWDDHQDVWSYLATAS
jgi:SAM-dependent methyltransferase